MRALKILTVAMGVAIIVATAALGVLIARRLSGAGAAPPFARALAEPDGTRLTALAGAGDRLALWLQGGGADRIVLVDPHTGAVTGRVALSAAPGAVPSR
ncbi:MAG: hypothetical protein JOZ42_05600 [Acetobacteraceae bacterium]|nr:hypothetical protein [Acetobacteraceae bacterium]